MKKECRMQNAEIAFFIQHSAFCFLYQSSFWPNTAMFELCPGATFFSG
jgi:hypothetical protein